MKLHLGFGIPMELAASNTFNYRHLVRDVVVVIMLGAALTVTVGVMVTLHAGHIAAAKNISVRVVNEPSRSARIRLLPGPSSC